MKKRKNLKGFTLIELIIVMAIFGILMTAVMQVITPLNKLSKRASIQEANSAVVDNMKAYLEGTLRYSNVVEVYSGGLTDDKGILFAAKGVTDEADQREVVLSQFIDNHFTNRLNPGTDEPLTGNVRMLKIDNLNDGRVTEYEYNFTAGYTYTHFNGGTDDDGNPIDVTKRVTATVSESKVGSKEVFNPVYYENYSFYFVPGYNETVTQFDTSLIDRDASAFADDTADEYYASVERIKTASGTVYADLTPEMFSLSVMAYKNDKDASNNPTHRMNLKDDSATTADESLIPVFKSPFALSNINMSLVNINSQFSEQNINDLYGAVRYHGSATEGDGEDGAPVAGETYDAKDVVKKGDKTVFRKITTTDAPLINKRFCNHGEVDLSHADNNGFSNDGCIYIIYTLPEYN